MQIRIFIIPIKNVDHSEIEMNRFLRSHRVLAVNKKFVVDGENSFRTKVPFCFPLSSTNASDGCEVDPVASTSPASQSEVAGKYIVIRSGASSADSILHRTLPTGSLN
jgi:hypothetical protein